MLGATGSPPEPPSRATPTPWTGSGARVRWATLQFNTEAALWVANEEWHAERKSRWLPDGRYELQVPYSEPTELAMDILRHGDSVTVVGDKEIASAIAKRLAAAAALYNSQ